MADWYPPLPENSVAHEAVLQCDAAGLAALGKKYPNMVQWRDSRGYTPLMMAVENVEAREVTRQLIVDLGADVNVATVRVDGAASLRIPTRPSRLAA